jgi:hypothetical protein
MIDNFYDDLENKTFRIILEEARRRGAFWI